MFPVMHRFTVLYSAVLLMLVFIAVSPARADYVATAQEEREWTARIAKAPPSNEVLGGAPFPGAKLDTRRSGEKTAENRGKPMVYIYIARASVNDVRAYYDGPGKRAAGAPIIVNSHAGVEIMYYMREQKAAAPAPAAAREASAPVQQHSQPAPAAQAPAEPQQSAAAPAPAAPAPASTPTPSAPAAPDAAKQTLDAVNTLRGLFGR